MVSRQQLYFALLGIDHGTITLNDFGQQIIQATLDFANMQGVQVGKVEALFQPFRREMWILARPKPGEPLINKVKSPRQAILLTGKYVDTLQPAIEISLATGLRRGELFSLTWAHVDLDNCEIRIKGEKTKSYQTRKIPLNDRTVSVLRKWKLQQGRTRDNLVFQGNNGRQLTSLKKSYYKVIKDAGIVRVTDDISLNWHSLRHTFGTRLGQAGVDPATIKKLMGHASLLTTQRYLHSDEVQMREAIEKLA